MKKHIDIRVKGYLQRAGIRFKTMEAAYRFGVTGRVRYLKDYSLLIEAEGDGKDLERFVNWCKKGPVGTKVDEVTIEEAELKNYPNFDIISGLH